MIEALIALFIAVVILGAVWYIITRLIPLPEPFGMIAQIVLAVILILVVLHFLLPFAGIRSPV